MQIGLFVLLLTPEIKEQICFKKEQLEMMLYYLEYFHYNILKYFNIK